MTSVTHHNIDRMLESKMAANSQDSASARLTLLPNLSPSGQTSRERMKEYSSILSARSSTRPATQLSTIYSQGTRSPEPHFFKSRQQQRKTAKSMGNEIYCNPCLRDNMHHEAAGYCVECSEYFCETCIKHHKNLKITKNHTMQDRRKMPKLKHFIPDEETIEICDKHPDELVRYFCTDHDEPSCGVCATLKHRSCKEVLYIPELKSKETNKSCINKIKHMSGLISQFEKSKQDTERNLQMLDMQRNDYQQAILKVHQDVTDHLHKLEREAILSMDRLYESEQGYLTTRAESCKDAIKSLQQATSQLDSAKKNGVESKVFLHVKKVTKLVTSQEELLTDISKKNAASLQFKFRADAKVKEFLKSASLLGSLLVTQRPERTITPLTQFRVNSWSDTHQECEITGVCVLPDSRIVFADSLNENLKVVDNNYQMITQSKLSSPPWDLCPIGKDQVAVTLPKEKKIQYFTIGATIQPLRKVGHIQSLKASQYYGIDCYKDRLFVTCPQDEPPSVKILDLQGNQLQLIMASNQEQNLLQSPYYITVHNSGKSVYVSDSANAAIVSLEIQKSDVSDRIYEIPGETQPAGICALVEGDIYACATSTNSVLHLTTKGDVILDVIGSEGGLLRPKTIAFNHQGKQLIVTMEKSATVKVFQLS